MFRRMKKLTSTFIVALMLVFAFAPGASAATYGPSGTVNYVAIGDSVAVGMSSPNNYGYTTMYRDYLKLHYKTVNYTNLAYDGATSQDLYYALLDAYYNQNSPNALLLKNSNVITVNIGGFDVWGEFMKDAFTLYNPSGPTNDLIQDCTILYNGIKGDDNPLAKYKILSNNDYSSIVAAFDTRWKDIARLLRCLAPNATIYVNTMYSPMPVSDPLYYKLVKPLVDSLNGTIISNAAIGYKVVNINQALKAPGAVSYNIYTAILIAKYNQFNNYSLQAFMKSLDFHPTFYGHTIIFNKLINTQ